VRATLENEIVTAAPPMEKAELATSPLMPFDTE
jgi:hypothetical protein